MPTNQLLEINKNTCTDLVCFSHLRWDFVYQRPQHLMSRFAKQYRTFFVEEPLFHDSGDRLQIRLTEENVWIVTPYLSSAATDKQSIVTRQKQLINTLFADKKIEKFIAWYYTPMALKISSHLNAQVVVYDCMDELAAFKFAPAELKIMEAELFSKAHVVFTGGYSLFEAKKHAHRNIFPFPSSIDKTHFSKGRNKLNEPYDQQQITRLRFGFYGVIDERFNIQMIKEVAEKRPEWQLVLLGPVVKINPEDLPKLPNIHYLGSKSYSELPVYLSGWDFAIIPFEKNESTKYISPTKTPEYLAAGKPVISTSITDVVNPYGDKKLVYIADNADEFIKSAETELAKSNKQIKQWLSKVDAFLKDISWDCTTAEMMDKINDCLAEQNTTGQASKLKSVA
ncbi:glycosyltransferase family 1 protein [Ferruginibacter paludis]|uniref:glycosyltransferase family 1 protein n=1 Tax=Ferruginibacter paludis TaxID=1310417 RepID=UPI0025B349B8|nr:glycosyltransferase family 1 protein [Ferruginibacter paludis]MDN3656161.1 glycosyltransferase family 1 protein [Ferruginibacter paludis]